MLQYRNDVGTKRLRASLDTAMFLEVIVASCYVGDREVYIDNVTAKLVSISSDKLTYTVR